MKTQWDAAIEMSRTELRELESRLAVLLEHLMKISHVKGLVRADNLRGWTQTVRYQRRDLARHIAENKGLKSKINEALLEKVFRVASRAVKKEYPLTRLPSTRPPLKEILGQEVMEVLNRPDAKS